MDLISREVIKGTLEEHRNLFVMAWEGKIMSNYDKSRMDEISACIGEVQNCPSAFEGMTNREIISEFVERDDSFAIMVDEVNGTVNIELSLDFWNAPYKAESEGKE